MRIQIHTNDPTPSGSMKTTLEVEPTDTIRDVILKFVEKEGIKTNGLWSGLHRSQGSTLGWYEYLSPGTTLADNDIQSGYTLEFVQGITGSGYSEPLNVIR